MRYVNSDTCITCYISTLKSVKYKWSMNLSIVLVINAGLFITPRLSLFAGQFAVPLRDVAVMRSVSCGSPPGMVASLVH